MTYDWYILQADLQVSRDKTTLSSNTDTDSDTRQHTGLEWSVWAWLFRQSVLHRLEK